jgi:NTE family protein
MPDKTDSGRATRTRTRGRERARTTSRSSGLTHAGAFSAASSEYSSAVSPSASSPTHPKIGLALAGGGPLGGIYEVGALLALADSLDGLDFNKFDVYVGVSSGGFVAAALANGISPAQMYRLFIADGADAVLKPEIFLRPAFAEFGRCLTALPGLALRAAFQYLRDPFHRGAMESFATLAQAVPTGFFDNGVIDTFLARLFAAPGRTNDFRQLQSKLFLVATNLDSGASVNFGGTGHDHVPISRAIEASSALPGLFPPVTIDGQHYVDGALNKTLHASVALDEGVDLLLCVNPLVPFDASAAAQHGASSVRRLNQGGLPLVLGQTFRAIIHSRMKVGMEKYERQYPDADVLLFEPDREDADMFFANIFSYAQRKRLCSLAFDTTRANLLLRAEVLAPIWRRHGVTLRMNRLADPQRRVVAAVTDPRPLHPDVRRAGARQATRDLAHTLDQLERAVALQR